LTRPVTLLTLVAAPTYLAAFLYLRPDREPQTWESGEIAGHLMSGEGYSLHRFAGHPEPSANQEPLYPLLLAFFLKWVPAPYVSLLVVQVLAWLCAARLVAFLSHRLLAAPEAATALAVALWPPMLVYVLSYHPLWLRATALILTVAAAARYHEAPSRLRAAELGAALGIAALARTTFLALPIAILPWAIRRGRSPVLAHTALSLVVAGIVLAPWVIRNRIALGSWIPGTTTSGYALLIGNHSGGNGVMDKHALRRIHAELPVEYFSLPEADRDRVLRDRALAFLAENPGTALRLYVSKLLYLWTWRPGVGIEYSAGWTWVYLVLWGLALPLIFAGWRVASRRPAAAAPGLFLGVWAFMSILYAIFAVDMRFRFESEALLVPYAVLAVGEGWIFLRSRNSG
jgi:hypothetical protein